MKMLGFFYWKIFGSLLQGEFPIKKDIVTKGNGGLCFSNTPITGSWNNPATPTKVEA